MGSQPPPRPATPQPLLHRAPDVSTSSLIKPNKYIVLILASTSVAGKVQIATSVAERLACPLYQGDSLHESSAKAAAVGASRSNDGGKSRYQRMWMSKMTRTGLLFPDESKPAMSGFTGFGGVGRSRRGSSESIESTISYDSDISVALTPAQYVNKSVLVGHRPQGEQAASALMVLTHPDVESWHKDCIREAVGEYGIGVIFVPLERRYEEQTGQGDLPVLQPLSSTLVRRYTSFDALRSASTGYLPTDGGSDPKDLESQNHGITIQVDLKGTVEAIVNEVVHGVQNDLLI